VRIKIEARSSNRSLETSALVNTGFETERPQLLIPLGLAQRLGLWPLPDNAEAVVLGTAGGPSRMYLLKDVLKVSLVMEGEEVSAAECDALISDIEVEALINDKLGEELGIVIERMGSGEWRCISDSPETRRKSERPEYWRKT